MQPLDLFFDNIRTKQSFKLSNHFQVRPETDGMTTSTAFQTSSSSLQKRGVWNERGEAFDQQRIVKIYFQEVATL